MENQHKTDIGINELITEFLKFASKDKNGGFFNVREWASRQYSITDDEVKTAVNIMISAGWVTPTNHNTDSVKVNHIGRMFLQAYGSFEAYLAEQEHISRKEKRKEAIQIWLPHVWNVLSIALTLIFGLLAYLDSEKDKEVHQMMQKRIEKLELRLNSIIKEPASLHIPSQKH